MTREEAKKILEAYIACESKKAHFECSEYNCDDSCHLLYDMGTVGEYNEAINMAIQALEQEPYDDAKYHEEHGEVVVDKAVWEDAKKALEQEPCEDAISRDAVLEMAYDMSEIDGEHFTEPCMVVDVDYIKSLPSVNPQEPNTVIATGDGAYYKIKACEDAISREELLKAINTWDRFGVDDTNSLFRLDNLSLPHYVPYIHYDDVVKCIKGMPPVNPQEPKWDRLYSWLNDMRFGIAPDETVTDIDERNERQAQVDLLDEIMEWMVEPQERSDKE